MMVEPTTLALKEQSEYNTVHGQDAVLSIRRNPAQRVWLVQQGAQVMVWWTITLGINCDELFIKIARTLLDGIEVQSVTHESSKAAGVMTSPAGQATRLGLGLGDRYLGEWSH